MDLTRGGVDLLESTLLVHLRDLAGGARSLSFGLGSLSGGLSSLLGFLVLFSLGFSGGLSVLGLLRSSFLDQFNRGTDDGSLVLDGLSGSSLGGFFRDTLLVGSSVQNGPRDSSGVLSLVEQQGRLRRLESEHLRVPSHEEGTSTGVDLSTRKGVNFNLHLKQVSDTSLTVGVRAKGSVPTFFYDAYSGGSFFFTDPASRGVAVAGRQP